MFYVNQELVANCGKSRDFSTIDDYIRKPKK